ncbi:unnamed protein product [Durusdinium trenchii]|uniref:Uncharacterized protein n=1 Tax=Durusdinium trenchii TaxID=1381693 RepID=A0ABP0QU30_9DINO
MKVPESRTASPATKAHEQAETASTLSFMVRHVTLKKWLKRVYLAKLKDCTFTQFQVIVQNMLKCTIPEEALKEEIFLKCPLIPDDDKGELRAVADLGAALFAYTKHGLWPEALCLDLKSQHGDFLAWLPLKIFDVEETAHSTDAAMIPECLHESCNVATACTGQPPFSKSVPKQHVFAAMGGNHSSAPEEPACISGLPATLLPSRYKQRVAQLVDEVQKSPMPEPLEHTLRRCIAFCYDVTEANEHQLNVPVYHAMLCCFGEPGFQRERVSCKAVPATDVEDGFVKPSVFWTRQISGQLHFRSLAHALLKWFADLAKEDPRKQLLVNILLQLHEACYNCVGRHKEVFEYCIYDLLDAEDGECADSSKRVVCRHAAAFLDNHKRNALHAAFLSPLKYVFQNVYEVFENLDSHGASFWVAVLHVFFPDLDMPFENIEALDIGWAWGAVDFLPMMEGSGSVALARFSDPKHLGQDWRTLTRDLRPPRWAGVPRFRGLPLRHGPAGFKDALRRIRQQPALQRAFACYIDRFTSFFTPAVLLQRWAYYTVTSERWDMELGPALVALRGERSCGVETGADQLREELCSTEGQVNLSVASALLEAAGVSWAKLV